ncbi:biosynthetic arginine decarboxylase [Bermanella marisrubri]|uniref:Arginine decarboxylase n=1 Tax=Bermanella marisrubri TaxID=207949 RepID=Q1N474_9GAMM|nr:biosynthetic arginine decarboxylase [Bermanella marisrubri]EAT12991.1 arginine decarboxylase [Oceanobacter sp. RED65] [Bermanella marisrubri]QIZ82882.1 biosynthetic arginine decarboxylase [Bermanella marisrubri]
MRTKPLAAPPHEAPWSAQDSADLYGVNDWGCDFFKVSDNGELEVQVDFKDHTVSVPLIQIIEGMQERGLEMPAILRIENLLDARISALNEAFARAIQSYQYGNVYRGVFPIKVNQQCHVVEEIADFGSRYHHGLEAGSKAELIIALSKLHDNESMIVCNGYKDAEFIELGLYAKEMGINCIFVLESLKELPIILERSEALGIEPLLGVRIRSSVTVDGHWNEDSGDRSIFGMSTHSLVRVVEELKQANMLHCLQLLHCHLGSQIPNIRNIRMGVMEACRFYSGLIEQGAPMGYLDLGGGLAVDYEGASSNHTHSMNYQLDEYCNNIVETIQECLDPENIPHPVIVTESGRATVAYSSMLLFNTLDVRTYEPAPLPESLADDASSTLQSLWQVNQDVGAENYQECYNDALFYRDEIQSLFRRGQASLSERAIAENIALSIFQKVAKEIRSSERVPEEMQHLPQMLADIYYGNFSVFQSLPDTWAIDQVFPVMPIHRLDEKPTRDAMLADLTCDCDGKIDVFATAEGTSSTLALHSLKEEEEYYLGVFLVGAYQETLGDLHNLFGDTHVVSVAIREDGRFDFVREIHGDSIADVLSYVEYDPRIMSEELRQRAEKAVRQGRITPARRKQMLKAFKASLDGYTYFERGTL